MTVTNNLVGFYISMYNAGTASLNLIFDVGVSKEVFLSTYKSFVAEKILTPIEELPKDEKIKLVEECKKTGLEFTNSTLVNSAKILHTIKFINENS